VITECPQIDTEVRDGFIRHVRQQMINKNSITTTIVKRIDSKQFKIKHVGNCFG
jgi:hypothetical protein